MKIAATVARYLLGLMFTVFGLNAFLHFLHPPAPASALAGQFMTVLSGAPYLIVVFGCQLLAGLLLLSGRFVPLALTILAPIIVNILTYHVALDPAGIGPGLFAAILWVVVFVQFRWSFEGLLKPRTASAA